MEEDIDVIKASIDTIQGYEVDSWCQLDNLIVGSGDRDCENCMFYFPKDVYENCIEPRYRWSVV